MRRFEDWLEKQPAKTRRRGYMALLALTLLSMAWSARRVYLLWPAVVASWHRLFG